VGGAAGEIFTAQLPAQQQQQQSAKAPRSEGETGSRKRLPAPAVHLLLLHFQHGEFYVSQQAAQADFKQCCTPGGGTMNSCVSSLFIWVLKTTLPCTSTSSVKCLISRPVGCSLYSKKGAPAIG
jgi:hypothetical protein